MDTKKGYIQFSKLVFAFMALVWLLVLVFGVIFTWITQGPIEPVFSYVQSISGLVIPYTATSIVDKTKDMVGMYCDTKAQNKIIEQITITPPETKKKEKEEIKEEKKELISDTNYDKGPGIK